MASCADCGKDLGGGGVVGEDSAIRCFECDVEGVGEPQFKVFNAVEAEFTSRDSQQSVFDPIKARRVIRNGQKCWKVTCPCGKSSLSPRKPPAPIGSCPGCGTKLFLPGLSHETDSPQACTLCGMAVGNGGVVQESGELLCEACDQFNERKARTFTCYMCDKEFSATEIFDSGDRRFICASCHSRDQNLQGAASGSQKAPLRKDGARYWLLDKKKDCCDGCAQNVDGFLISDGRFICPYCAPRAVWDRWQAEWGKIEKKVEAEKRAVAEKEAREERERLRKKQMAEASAERERQRAAAIAEEARRPPVRCDQCGKSPAIKVSFIAAIGRIVFAKQETYEGTFCKGCGLGLYAQVMKRHLANTAFSATTLIFGSTLGTGHNLLEKQKLERLADPKFIETEAEKKARGYAFLHPMVWILSRVANSDGHLDADEQGLLRTICANMAGQLGMQYSEAEISEIVGKSCGDQVDEVALAQLMTFIRESGEGFKRTILKLAWRIAARDGEIFDSEIQTVMKVGKVIEAEESDVLYSSIPYLRRHKDNAEADKALRLLGLDRSATAESAKAAYRSLAKKYHPDVHAAAAPELRQLAAERFSEVKKAFDYLQTVLEVAWFARVPGQVRTVGKYVRGSDAMCFMCDAVHTMPKKAVLAESRCEVCQALLLHEENIARAFLE